MYSHVIALVLGFALDIMLGDPHALPHPIRLIGAFIAKAETLLRRVFPATPQGEYVAGVVLVVGVAGVSCGAVIAVLALCGFVSPWLALVVEAVIDYYMLATRSLATESGRVQHALEVGTLDDARYAVSMIVGRDTAQLTEEGVTKAAVETVAENTVDGVVAPLLFMAIGGAPAAVLYKAVNTMDSMVGYRNERYEHFGCAAARIDDVLNFIPARIGGVLMVVAATLTGEDGAGAWRIFTRDRKNHASPNSAHTEAACAGALGVQLAGGAFYFGKFMEKPTIGDATRPIVPADIARAHKLLYVTAALCLVIGVLLSIGMAQATGGVL